MAYFAQANDFLLTYIIECLSGCRDQKDKSGMLGRMWRSWTLAGGWARWCVYDGKEYWGSLNKNSLSHAKAGYLPKELKLGSQRDINHLLGIAAPFVLVDTWKQPRCLYTDLQICNGLYDPASKESWGLQYSRAYTSSLSLWDTAGPRQEYLLQRLMTRSPCLFLSPLPRGTIVRTGP